MSNTNHMIHWMTYQNSMFQQIMGLLFHWSITLHILTHF